MPVGIRPLGRHNDRIFPRLARERADQVSLPNLARVLVGVGHLGREDDGCVFRQGEGSVEQRGNSQCYDDAFHCSLSFRSELVRLRVSWNLGLRSGASRLSRPDLWSRIATSMRRIVGSAMTYANRLVSLRPSG